MLIHSKPQKEIIKDHVNSLKQVLYEDDSPSDPLTE